MMIRSSLSALALATALALAVPGSTQAPAAQGAATTAQADAFVAAAEKELGDFSVFGAQVGVKLAGRVRPEWLRLALGVIVLLVATRILLGLVWRPEEIFTVELA